MHLVEGVLQDTCNSGRPVTMGLNLQVSFLSQLTHLPYVFGRVRLIEKKLDAEVEVVALDAKVPFMINQVGNVVPLEELRRQSVALSDNDT